MHVPINANGINVCFIGNALSPVAMLLKVLISFQVFNRVFSAGVSSGPVTSEHFHIKHRLVQTRRSRTRDVVFLQIKTKSHCARFSHWKKPIHSSI